MGKSIGGYVILSFDMSNIQVIRLQKQSPSHQQLIWILKRPQECQWIVGSVHHQRSTCPNVNVKKTTE